MSRHCKSCKKEIHREIKNGNYYCNSKCQKNYRQKLYGSIKPSEDVKTCKGCNEEKPGSDFVVDHNSPDGRSYNCRVCYKERSFREGKGMDPRLSVRMRIGYDLYLKILKRDNYRCQCCNIKVTAIYDPENPPAPEEHYKETALELDHIDPEFNGGPTVISNLQVTCRKCNANKGKTLPGDQDEAKTKHVQNYVIELDADKEAESTSKVA